MMAIIYRFLSSLLTYEDVLALQLQTFESERFDYINNAMLNMIKQITTPKHMYHPVPTPAVIFSR